MKVTLSIYYSANKWHQLMEERELIEMDKFMSSNFSNEEEFRMHPFFSSEITDFCAANRPYIMKIEDPEERRGRIVYTYLDHGKIHNMLPLYESDAKYLDTNLLVKRISSTLKKENDPSLILKVLDDNSFMFGSTHHEKMFHLTQYKEILKNLSRSQLESIDDKKDICHTAYSRLTSLIKETIGKPDSDSTDRTYFRARKVDESIRLNIKKSSVKLQKTTDTFSTLNIKPRITEMSTVGSQETLKIDKENVETLFKQFISTYNPNDYHGMGDLKLEYDEWEEERKHR